MADTLPFRRIAYYTSMRHCELACQIGSRQALIGELPLPLLSQKDRIAILHLEAAPAFSRVGWQLFSWKAVRKLRPEPPGELHLPDDNWHVDRSSDYTPPRGAFGGDEGYNPNWRSIPLLPLQAVAVQVEDERGQADG